MIVIVGGGISGLTVAEALDRAGRELVVFEAADRAGGVIGSIRVEGRVLELGPQRTRLTPPFRRLVERLGLGDRLVTAPPGLPLFVHVDGRLRPVPLDLRTAFRTDLLSWPDRLRALREPFTGRLRPDETAGAFFTRKFGRRVYERVIAPLYGGLYASDPDRMPARHALAETLETLGVRRSLLVAMVHAGRGRERAPACSFDAGLRLLTDALAARLGDRLRLGTAVTELRRQDGRLRVATERGDDVVADHVILACPAGAAARILRPLAPDAADRLATLQYNPLALVHLLADANLRGLGYQVAFGEALATRGVTWNAALFGPEFGRDGLFTAFLGGATRAQVPQFPADALRELAVGEFRQVTGEDARAIHVHRTAMPAWDASWDALDGLELPAGVVPCASWWGRPGITGRLVEAGRVAEAVSSGAASGAATSPQPLRKPLPPAPGRG